MTTYRTGNPIGSTDPRDLYDNAENLDVAVNDPSRDTWSDRLGRSRKTISGMDREFNTDQASRNNRFNTFIASSGYQFLGDYADGIEISEYNQIVRDADGEFWRLSGQVDLPYTTTGAGLPENDALTPLGDAVLRQDLESPNQGAALIGRGAVSVSGLASLGESKGRDDQTYLVRLHGNMIEYEWVNASTARPDGIAVIAPDPSDHGRYIALNWRGNEWIDSADTVPFSGTPVNRLVGVIAGALVGASGTRLHGSMDAGESWELLCDTGVPIGSDASAVYEMDNGEILLNTAQALHVSSGWSENPSTATFTTTHTVANPSVERFHPGWGVSVAGSYVYACEYGNPKPSAFNGYLSKDFGLTFQKVFDLRDHWPANNNSHNHGCCVDPWHNNRLWQLTADTPTIGAFYSDNDGLTWNKLPDGRFPIKADGDMGNYVTMIATPGGIVCGTDTEPNGIAMIVRDRDYASNPKMEQIFTFIDGDNTLTHVAQFNAMVGGVVYTAFGQVTGNRGYASRITATHPESRQSWLVWEDPSPTDDSRRLLSLFASGGYLFGRFEPGRYIRLPLGQGRSVKGNDVASHDTGWVLGGNANPDQRTLSVGVNSEAAIGGTAVGQYTLAGSNGSVAVGRGSQALAADSLAIGGQSNPGEDPTTANATAAIAIGPRAFASGQSGVAVGQVSTSSATNSVAVGTASSAAGASSIAIGYQASASLTEGTTLGRGATSANRGAAIGAYSDASGQRSAAVGHTAVANATNSAAIGANSIAAHSNSIALGAGTETTKTGQVAIGERDIEILEMATGPGTPSPGAARIYLTISSGVRSLRIRFPNGQDKLIADDSSG